MGSSGKPTVLVADDSSGHRKVLEMLLSAYNYQVIAVADGHQALTYLQSNTPDLMILDVDMPFMTGLDVCGRARRIARLRDVPVIIMTALSDDKTKALATKVDADMVVHKPITGKNVSGMISKLMASKAQPATSLS